MEIRSIPFLLMLALLVGCVTEKTRTSSVVNYVCPDRSIVSDPGGCEIEELEKIAVTKYVCSDGTLEESPDKCPRVEPQLVKVLRYVCYDGSVVNESQKCPQPADTTTTSTTLDRITTTMKSACTSTASTTTSTTTTSTTTSTQPNDSCSALGCPLGTNFVGSLSSDKYHRCDCRYAKKIKPENIVCFSSGEDAESKGYVPCGSCKP